MLLTRAIHACQVWARVPGFYIEPKGQRMSEQPDQAAVEAAIGGADQDSDKESYHGYSVDDEDQPQDTGDSLTDARGLEEPLEEGYSPGEKWSAGQRWGNTPLEEELGETLDQRLEQEVPEPDPYQLAESENLDPLVDPEGVGAGDDLDEPGELESAGAERAGRLVDADEGTRSDTEKDLIATDVGIDGAGASAEEAAVHVVEDDLP
jgi:hypothetical protein